MGEKDENRLTESERGLEGTGLMASVAQPRRNGEGLIIKGFYPCSIVQLKDGRLMTATGQYSADNGRSWSDPNPILSASGVETYGLLRLPNGELGYYYTDNRTIESACGNNTNNMFFIWSQDEGRTWSDGVKVSLDGLTMGLVNTMFALKSGRLAVVTYSQFLSPMKLWGASMGTYKGFRIKTETEGHFGQMEVARVYYSDDSGRSWKSCDGWIMGYRDGYEKWVDSFVEAYGVELDDGRILLMGRSLVGRVFKSISEDSGESFGYAHPTTLMTSDSPGVLAKLPNGHLLFIWNQISREENRRGLRRCRLSSAISGDGGDTWSNFKNIYSIDILADRHFIPEEPSMTPVAGDDEVGALPDDFELWHYSTVNIIGDRIFLSYHDSRYEVKKTESREKTFHYSTFSSEVKEDGTYLQPTSSADTLILPVSWFYS